MICKCPKCDGALEYNPGTDAMDCPYCGSNFAVSEIMMGQDKKENPVGTSESQLRDVPYWDMTPYAQAEADERAREKAEQKEKMGGQQQGNQETMSGNIYTCTTCGAELFVNGVEASTFCAYCGQPTIVFSRVSKELMPKYILPFRIQKEQAVNGIREKLNKGFFVPREIKNFEVERVRGIYIPYFMFDVYYHDFQQLKGTVGSGKHRKTKHFLREAECEFRRVTCDASRQLNDESSQRLEPFDLRMLKPFDVGYLSGFYADRYDMTDKELTCVVVGRVRELFDDEMKKSVNARNVKITARNPNFKIHGAEYALLPAWFLTFRYQDEPYTILVNGQTGKIVGAVPFDKVKLCLIFALIAFLATIIFTFLLVFLIKLKDANMFVVYVTSAVIMYTTGLGAFKSVKKNIKLTKARRTNRFVKERQEDS